MTFSGWVPKRLERVIRVSEPPMLVCTTLRMVLPGSPFGVPGSGPTGAADQVPVQLPDAGTPEETRDGAPAETVVAGDFTMAKMPTETSVTTAARVASRA